MPPKAPSKNAKNQKAKVSQSKSKSASKDKKRWSKGQTKEKLKNSVIFDQETHNRLMKELPTYKIITASIVSDRLKVNASLARTAIRELSAMGLIQPVINHHAQLIYTRAIIVEEVDKTVSVTA